MTAGANNSSDTESLPSPHSSEDSKVKEETPGKSKAAAAAAAAAETRDKDETASDLSQTGEERASVKEESDAVVKQEIKTEAAEPPGKNQPQAEAEEAKAPGKGAKKEQGTKTGSHGDSDSSATCSADEVEEPESAEKNR